MTEETAYPTDSEGFRDVCWGTRQGEISWKWSDDGFGQMCFVREDEDFQVFGIRASAPTYTFRNSILYGERIDFEDVEQNDDAEGALLDLYVPTGSVRDRGKGEISWQTAQTSVYSVFNILRARFAWWPLHPIRLTLATSWPIKMSAFSLFLGWLCKWIIVRLGGIQLYQRARPLFLGLILGYFAGVAVSSVIDFIWFPGQGHWLDGLY